MPRPYPEDLEIFIVSFNPNFHNADADYHTAIEIHESKKYDQPKPSYFTKYFQWKRVGHLDEFLLIQASSEVTTATGCLEKDCKSTYTCLKGQLDHRLRSGNHIFNFDDPAEIEKVKEWIKDFKPRTFYQSIDSSKFNPRMTIYEAASMLGVSKVTITNKAKSKNGLVFNKHLDKARSDRLILANDARNLIQLNLPQR